MVVGMCLVFGTCTFRALNIQVPQTPGVKAFKPTNLFI